ncbi:transcription termination/antitermination protein NusA [Candidatus Falkowbacteria bacterium]|jgi:transcription termination/antitermination protein NusA|nr:transcription termination/antitermination protein NusA [Candidatus Falkowbacteria bacterium]MBT5502674.1 transcription termination/antitermination protein NusA [Candidatus Falkowbacteria bacterium]MBT6574164.1 transcription termination/antitermination protein NusA [Candidatus Falkowbacteria bacterium]MBT7348689.1 transcription termination/antitermination protein NusA [Candidatus Falkowbacteria bacterium]MBT7500479.1 transcription termination/antitermination protein NusA [Candidatus Falkowbac
MENIKQVIKQICAEKGLSEDSVLETINSALAAAFRKDFGDKTQNIQAEFDASTAQAKIFDIKEVVEDLSEEELEALEQLRIEREELKEKIANGEISAEELKQIREEKEAQRLAEHNENKNEGEGEEDDDEARRFNPKTQIQIKEAKEIKKSYKLGDFVKTELDIPGEFGRMAAQTAKQVIIQKLREAERNIIYQDYKEKEGQIVTGMVQKFDGRNIVIDLDKASAILPPHEQIRGERFKVGDRAKVYLSSIALTTRGPEIIVSRAHPEIVKMLFGLEIPEIANGIIEIKGIAREAGSRTKIAVHTEDENIDPIGSCIGQRGARIQTIINELNGEKIDIIEYSDDPIKFITNALLPAKITNVEVDEKEKQATVTVPQDQLSLTIGRAGQNVRLASKLTDWRLNIKEQESGKEIGPEEIGMNSTDDTKEKEVVAEVSTEKAEKEEKPSKTSSAAKKKKKVVKKTTVKKATKVKKENKK